MGWGDVRYCFAMAILVIILIITILSSISVWRVTCYDHFCVFQFFSILAISMATAAILKKINPIQHNFTWHMNNGMG
jgi:hypothetical protein